MLKRIAKSLAKKPKVCYKKISDSGEKPIEKNADSQKANQNKGATPIEKNVIVVDEQGNEYEATYPKRAKGLVKNGRARFVGENKICLACPPGNIMEDNKMTDTEIKVDEITGEVVENSEGSTKYTRDYALEQLERVRSESAKFALETREKICEIKSGGTKDVGAKAAVEALLALVQEQEQIYHRMIDFYIKIVSDLSPTLSIRDHDSIDPVSREQFLQFVSNCIAASETSMDLSDYEKIWNMIKA